MKMIKSIPALPVQKMDKAIEFYQTKLGFSVPYHDDDFAKLIRDEVEIHPTFADKTGKEWNNL